MPEYFTVGIDATAVPLNRAGAGNYIFNLVTSLTRIDRENRYVVFAASDLIKEWDITAGHVSFIPIARMSPTRRLIWEQTVFPTLIHRHGLDLLHSPHYTFPLTKPCRHVVTIHDLSFFVYPQMHTRAKRHFFRNAIRLASRRADHLITVSESTRTDLMRFLATVEEKITVTQLGKDEHFRAVDDTGQVLTVCGRFGLEPGGYILFVGILEPRKNIDTLIKAFATISVEHPNLRLAVVGKKGWMFEELFSLVSGFGLAGRVVFTDYVPGADLPALYTGALCSVYPTHYEGFGIPVLEAMACGTPVITSHVSSIPEVLGGAGITIEPANEDQLVAALQELLGDPERRRKLSYRGLQRAELFSWARMATETAAVYRKVLGRA